MKAMVIGGATIDVITSIAPGDIELITMHNATHSYLMMEQGKKVEATQIGSHIGGGAANAAVCMARLGGDISCLLKLGNDVEADLILSRLKEENINTAHVTKDMEHGTGKSIIVSSHDRNAGIFVNRGANTTLRAEHVTPELFEGVDLVYVSTLSSRSAGAFPKIAQLAKEAGAFVACNPGIRQIRLRKEELLSTLQWIDLIAINNDEAAALAQGLVCPDDAPFEGTYEKGELYHEGLGEKGEKISLAAFTKKITSLGCSHLMVTNGSEGAYLCMEKTILFRPTVPCDVASTIGAGDAFNGTLAFALADKQSAWTALAMAAINASSVATKLDTQSGLMQADALNSRLLSMDVSRIPDFPV